METLHMRLLARDGTAIDEVYREYGSAAYGLALRVTGQPSLAQDAVQDAFLALWHAPQAYQPSRGAFRTFFLSMVHHRAVDAVRREERQRAKAERVQRLEEATTEDVADGIADVAWMTQRRAAVRMALASLPEHQRVVVELAYFRGYTQQRIADELGIPLGTVKTRTLAAMRRLRRDLSAEPRAERAASLT
ncbi:MAG TPA: sigma-70 family RNA polymerase sigma factor [Actinomycetota bacterium]